ncbi:MAG: amidohydrolase family protein [Ktedonobacteraceae bacterium]
MYGRCQCSARQIEWRQYERIRSHPLCIVDALCFDYYLAAMLASVFTLASQHILTLPHATRMVTINPAQAAGQGHFIESLTTGNIANLIIVTLQQQRYPLVQHVFVAGLERVGRQVF